MFIFNRLAWSDPIRPISTEERPLHSLRLLERFRALEDFEAEDQDALIKLIDAMIFKNKVEGAITPFQKKAS